MISKERKFLHDIATPISIVKLTVKKVINNLEAGAIDPQKDMERLQKISAAIQTLEEMHAAHKIEITE